jgi:hypothetical protein
MKPPRPSHEALGREIRSFQQILGTMTGCDGSVWQSLARPEGLPHLLESSVLSLVDFDPLLHLPDGIACPPTVARPQDAAARNPASFRTAALPMTESKQRDRFARLSPRANPAGWPEGFVRLQPGRDEGGDAKLETSTTRTDIDLARPFPIVKTSRPRSFSDATTGPLPRTIATADRPEPTASPRTVRLSETSSSARPPALSASPSSLLSSQGFREAGVAADKTSAAAAAGSKPSVFAKRGGSIDAQVRHFREILDQLTRGPASAKDDAPALDAVPGPQGTGIELVDRDALANPSGNVALGDDGSLQTRDDSSDLGGQGQGLRLIEAFCDVLLSPSSRTPGANRLDEQRSRFMSGMHRSGGGIELAGTPSTNARPVGPETTTPTWLTAGSEAASIEEGASDPTGIPSSKASSIGAYPNPAPRAHDDSPERPMSGGSLPAAAAPGHVPPLDPRRLADLIDDMLVDQARRNGMDLR